MMVLITTRGRARLWRLARLSVLIPVVAVLGHDAVFAARHGLGRELAGAMREGNHDGWWGALTVAVLAAAAIALVVQVVRIVALSRRVPRRRRSRVGSRPGAGYMREWLALWATLLPAAATIFVVQEELEHRAMGVAGHGVDVLVGHEHPLAIPVLTLVTGFVAALAALVRWRIRRLESIIRGAPRSVAPRRVALRAAPPAWATIARPVHGGIVGLAFDAGRAPPASS